MRNVEWGINSICIHSEFRVPHSEAIAGGSCWWLGVERDQGERGAEGLEDGVLFERAGGGARAAGQLLGFAAVDEVGDAVVVEVGVGGEAELGDLLWLLAGLE